MTPPTPREMKEFSKRFTLEEWAILCRNQGFLDTIVEDLITCRLLAERVLSKHYKTESR